MPTTGGFTEQQNDDSSKINVRISKCQELADSLNDDRVRTANNIALDDGRRQGSYRK